MLPLLLLLLADDPTFHARTSSGKDVRGPLASLSGWDVEVGDKVRRKIAGKELLWLRRDGVPLPELPSGEHLVLTDGSRVPFRAARLDGDNLLIRHPDFGPGDVGVPLSAISLIWRTGPDGEPLPERTRRRLVAARPARDQLRLCNGDVIEGTLNALGETVEVERDRKTLKTGWAQVSAVALAAEAAAAPRGLRASVVVLPSASSPGGRFTVKSASLDGADFVGTAAFGAKFRVPLERVARVEVLGGAGVPLSSLTPAKYAHTPYLDEKFPYGVDATHNGRDLRLGGTWDRGIGMPGGSSLTFDLKGAYRHFEALVGLDDIEGRGGKVRVAVLIDGKAADLGPRDALGEPLTVSVDVTGAKSLTLEVRYAGRGPVGASVNWVDARLVR